MDGRKKTVSPSRAGTSYLKIGSIPSALRIEAVSGAALKIDRAAQPGPPRFLVRR
jgi:hypothetical protein